MATNDAIGEQNEMKLDMVCSIDVWSHLDLQYSFEVLTERARELKILRTSLQKKRFLCWASRYVGRTQNKERGSQPTAPSLSAPWEQSSLFVIAHLVVYLTTRQMCWYMILLQVVIFP